MSSFHILHCIKCLNSNIYKYPYRRLVTNIIALPLPAEVLSFEHLFSYFWGTGFRHFFFLYKYYKPSFLSQTLKIKKTSQIPR